MDPLLRYGGMNATQTRSEVIRVPDRMVGLIIGKGGEQIANIQAMSECRIQFASGDLGRSFPCIPGNSFGLPERECTLSGSNESIMRAKELITQLMCKGHDLPVDIQNSTQTIEVMIPGNKAGVIIGKGGETIRQLQEQIGVKMVIIQENNVPTSYDKPLRITGDKTSCQKAKEKVLELLTDKDGQTCGVFAEYAASNQRTSIDIPVNRSVIGIVIGKGGEMIKKIQQESGARIQFRPEDESAGPNRLCNITGNSEQMQTAIGLIQEIVERQGSSNNNNNNNNSWNKGPGSIPDSGKVQEETTFCVPAHKCGLVIGKGGDTIREICRVSGARVELIRDPVTSSSPERIFKIQGSPEQMQTAIRLISDKVSPIVPNTSLGLNRDTNNMCGQHTAGVQDQALQQILQQQNFMSPIQTWQTSFQTAYAQTSPNLSSPVDQLKQAELQNQWAAFFFNQQLMPQQQSQFLQRTTLPSPAGINPQTGQPDYSLQWADYYRQQGMHQQAQAILQAAATSHLAQ